MITPDTLKAMIREYRVHYTHPFGLGLPSEFSYMYDDAGPSVLVMNKNTWYGKGLGSNRAGLHNGVCLGSSFLNRLPSSELRALKAWPFGFFRKDYTELRCYKSQGSALSSEI